MVHLQRIVRPPKPADHSATLSSMPASGVGSGRLPAIAARSVSKTFHVPEERRHTLKERVLHPRRRVGHQSFEALKDVTFDVTGLNLTGYAADDWLRVNKRIHTELSDHPERVNETPYEKGWMLLIAPEAAGDFDQLLDATAYQKLLDEQAQ